jgi:hypothetical protein
MKHHTIELQRLMETNGYEFYQFGQDGISVYYFTPNNQIMRMDDADCITFYLFMKD